MWASTAAAIAVAVVVVLVIVGLVRLVDSSYPHSSPGVKVIASDVARLPEGDTLVFLHQSGKTTYAWKLTYNGSSVRMHEDGWWIFGGSDITVPVSLGHTESRYMGWFQGTFRFTPEPGGWVRVAWPFGWDYRA